MDLKNGQSKSDSVLSYCLEMVSKNETLGLFIVAYNYKIFNFMDLAKAIQDILLPRA